MRTLAFGKYAALTLMVSVISLLSSCRNNDFDFEAAHGNLSESDIAYNDKFTELIGDIDPNHTWSTAQQSGVKVSIDIPGEHLLRIYTADPLTSTAFLLARYENIEGGTTHDLKFDIPASKTSFCAVLDSAEYRISKIVELDDNGFASFIMSEEEVSETRATRAAPSRDYSSCYSFRGDDANVYQSRCPTDIVDITNYDTTNSSSYKVVSGTTEINCHRGNCDIYFTNGNYTIDKFYVAANTNVYLLPGANVTFTMNEGLNNNQSNVVMSIARNATITVNNSISHGFKLYNQGTINCKNFELYATGFTYNAGTITTGLTKVANYNSEFVNAGTLTCSGLNVEGTGKFQNTGTVNVSGTTLVNSNSCTWRNEGSYTCNNFTYNAGSTDVINNCKLKVNNLFEILLGDTDKNCFENNGSIDTKDFKMGIGYLLMGSNAVLKATGDAIMNITKAHYGIYGIGNDYAVFTAPEIKKIAENQGYCATYGGKLYVATPKHFAQGKSGDYPYYQIEGSAKLVQNAPNAISSGDCSTGYTPSGTSSSAPDFGGGTGNTENSSSSINTSTSTTVDNPMHWIIACEDLPGETSDFDYNDIVFAVYHVGNTKTFQIKPLAAGGTLRAEILYRGSANDFWNTASVNVDGNELSEIHQWITKNPSAPHTTMLNTEKGADVASVINSIPVFTAEFANEVSMDNFADYFAVRVYQNNSSEETIIKSDVVENIPSTNSYKTAPRLICINSDDPTWQWMAERQPLYYHYTDFSNWASDKTAYTSWYQQIGSQEKQEFTIRWTLQEDSNSGSSTSGNNNNEVTPAQPTEEERQETAANAGNVVVKDQNNNIVNATATSIFVMEAHETKTFKFYDASGKEYTSVNFHFVVTNGGKILKAEGTKLESNNTTQEDKIYVVSAEKGNTIITSFSVKVKAVETTLYEGNYAVNNLNSPIRLAIPKNIAVGDILRVYANITDEYNKWMHIWCGTGWVNGNEIRDLNYSFQNGQEYFERVLTSEDITKLRNSNWKVWFQSSSGTVSKVVVLGSFEVENNIIGANVLWENDGSKGKISWTKGQETFHTTYRFALQGHNYNNECIKDFTQEEWDVIKSGTFYLLAMGNNYQVRITDGHWHDEATWTGQDLYSNSNHITNNGDGTFTIEIHFSESDGIRNHIDDHNLLFTGIGYTPLKLYYKQ